MFEWIDELMDATGCDYETALREYDATHNPDYNRMITTTINFRSTGNKKEETKMRERINEWIKELMDATGCDYETALRVYNVVHNTDYTKLTDDELQYCVNDVEVVDFLLTGNNKKGETNGKEKIRNVCCEKV